MSNNLNTMRRRFGGILTLFIVLIGIILLASLAGRFFYFFVTVEQQEVGIQFQGGRIQEIVGPGVYSDAGLFVRLEKVSSQAIPFEVSDAEIITKDKQRIGVVVTGDIFRPGLAEKDLILANWAEYRGLYLDNTAAASRVQSLARQAMKVCVGDRSFDQNVVGTSRDDLRNCIDNELNDLISAIGLKIANLVVPEIILSPEVQQALDAIVASRLATEKAAQDQLTAQAEAGAEQARQEGEIRVEQSRIQEQTRQQTILANLEQQRLTAQLAIIEAERANSLAAKETERQVLEAQKANELLGAQLDLDINQALAEAAVARAQSDLARDTLLAQLYQASPAYVQLLIAQTNASALKATDKIIFTPEGVTPSIILPGPGVTPTVDTTP